jgi:predicted nuclease with TOPRIM domain
MKILEKQLEKRLTDLRAEFEKGQQKLQELEAEASALRDMLLRISGAMQVLQEELDKAGSNGNKES